ncbi:hypothetical protein RpY1_020 [Ralstonia phage RpY1]|nr:hypothetical protein RpY1_020 [Ralstonia phage RpY1]
MSYAINHRKHIAAFLQKHPLATPAAIAKALPPAKRRRSSVSTIAATLLDMVSKREAVRVAHGLYASGANPITAHQVASFDDRLAEELLLVFERPMTGYTLEDLLSAARRAGATDYEAVRKLRALRAKGLLTGGTRQSPLWGLTEWGYSGHVYEPEIDIFS